LSLFRGPHLEHRLVGAYQNVAKNPLPPTESPEYLPTLLYTARAHIALNDPAAALNLVQADVLPAIRAIRALASYLQAKSSGSDVGTILDELRDLAIEVEGEEEEEHPLAAAGAGSGVVRVAAATAFVAEGELEEALTTLGVGTDKGVLDLEW
jgi:coatomer subunit epsilon